MISAVQYTYSREQVAAWLRGLLTIAWADGDFDPQERELITNITHHELAQRVNLEAFDLIEPEELATVLGEGTPIAENFLRTAVMVAIADGTYSKSEDYLLHQLCKALGKPENILEALRQNLENRGQVVVSISAQEPAKKNLAPLYLLRDWLDRLSIGDPRVARFLCKLIPSYCPFERDITLFGKKIVHIPPLCKLNPLYEQLVGLRFRALSYLANDCGEDVSPYI
ncbi:MAG TPA: nitrogenase [Richelia sp.]|nr:nitrogenase [Richelia sp.]